MTGVQTCALPISVVKIDTTGFVRYHMSFGLGTGTVWENLTCRLPMFNPTQWPGVVVKGMTQLMELFVNYPPYYFLFYC